MSKETGNLGEGEEREEGGHQGAPENHSSCSSRKPEISAPQVEVDTGMLKKHVYDCPHLIMKDPWTVHQDPFA